MQHGDACALTLSSTACTEETVQGACTASQEVAACEEQRLVLTIPKTPHFWQYSWLPMSPKQPKARLAPPSCTVAAPTKIYLPQPGKAA